MKKVYNIHIERQYPLPSPQEIHGELPISAEAEDFVAESRAHITDIIHGRDPRMMVITGPCSIDNPDAAREYMNRLSGLRKKVSDKLFLIMRTYFEKPRTTLGWKGLIYDPDLDQTFNIEKGLRMSRSLLLEAAAMHIPTATEFLDPIIPQYLSDLISWAAIGARTTESQTHRQMASGMSMPVGFKNATDGSIGIAIDAIKTASAKHSFLGVINDGRTGVFCTAGNPDCHIVLRGSAMEPNYTSEYIAFTHEMLKKNHLPEAIVVDCSHGNSKRNPANQPLIVENIAQQHAEGDRTIIGIMLESYLKTGNQPISQDRTYGLSVTDACIGWETTEQTILKLHDAF